LELMPQLVTNGLPDEAIRFAATHLPTPAPSVGGSSAPAAPQTPAIASRASSVASYASPPPLHPPPSFIAPASSPAVGRTSFLAPQNFGEREPGT
jgi:hypothetical protein